MDVPESPSPGGPNPQFRTAAIDAFLAGLSPWELMYLRNRLRDGRAKVAGLASFEDLPAELVCAIATEHLRLEDVLNCRRVSQTWRAAWDREAVCLTLCRYFFPGLVEVHGEDREQTLARDLFLREAEQFLRRRHGKPLQKCFIVWHDAWSSGVFRNKRPEGEEENSLQGYMPNSSRNHEGPPVVYGDGKVAWRPSNTRIVIDDLRTRQRQNCSLSQLYLSGLILDMESVTKDLLVVSARGSNTVHVWHLNLEKWRRVTLPMRCSACYAEGERAVFVTTASHVVSWSWGGKALELGAKEEADFPEKPVHRYEPPSVIWHPLCRNALFVSFVYYCGDPGIDYHGVLVIKYEEGKPIRRFTELVMGFAVSETDLPFRPSVIQTRCQKLNSHGLYLMAAVSLEDPENSISQAKTLLPVAVTSVGFNVLTETFVQRRYLHTCRIPAENFDKTLAWKHEPFLVHNNWRAAWGDQLLIGQRYGGSCTGWFQTDYYCSWAERGGSGLEVSECQLEVNHYMRSSSRGDFYCDDDFMVFTTKLGMLVWAFCNVPELPVLQHISDVGTH
ncbi:Uncharacterized protein TCAP_01707 [Tolypocladium capitatum]|uniref:Uncharacterized protein n=1 Tax=Tolypocladium capitatum TaxID=45235 RepID=A0A2K3QLF1_9HYPO|nr:Uncharacterized protein TCAP_01707 [Tolypocladium capitatum]